MEPGNLQQTIDTMRRYIQVKIAEGFHSAKDVETAAVDYLYGQHEPKVLKPIAERITREEFEAHGAAQKEWPPVTDCDLLDRAFGELERAGIVARQHFTCCGTCGATEIWGEIAAAREAGRKVRGYTFYHIQDTETAARGYGLLLFYGAVEKDEKQALRIANEIIDALQRQGLKTEWDGSWDKRIGVKLDWKRRQVKAAG
jgi:hypothetical protein